MRGLHEQPNAIVDSLRLTDRELMDLLNRRSERSDADEGEQPQMQPRSSELSGAATGELPRALVHFARHHGAVTYLARVRQFHDQGVVFLHGGYVHEGSPCALLLRMRDGSADQIRATVVRCRHVAGRVHEIVARFEGHVQSGAYVIGGE